MKKLITMVVIAFISISATTAGNKPNLNSVISKQLKVPSFLKNKNLDEKVNVQFKLTPEGKAVVVSVNTNNTELKNYIISEFPKMDFNKNSIETGLYFIDINFRVF